jgi:uncharacterized membrane protein YadS
MTGDDEDVAYTAACVTVFGSIAMFTYPLLPAVLLRSARLRTLERCLHPRNRSGGAAGFQDGKQAGGFETTPSTPRVMILAPTVICLNLMAAGRAGLHSHDHADRRTRPPLPLCILGFIALASANSVVTIPTEGRSAVVQLTTFLLSMALSAMGLETDFAKLVAKEIRPFLLSLSAFVLIAGFSLILVKMMGAASRKDSPVRWAKHKRKSRI